MKRKLSLVLVVSAMFVLSSQAQPKEISVSELTERMQKRFEKIMDATADFTQTVRFGFSKIEQQFSGVVSMKKPNKYRIESENQTVVTDGSTVWAFSPVNNQVVIDRYKENQNSVSPERFLVNLPSNYYVTIIGREKDSKQYNVKLVPKDDRSFIKNVRLWVEDGTWNVKKVVILDSNETETTYLISNLQTNTKIGNNRFTFVASPGTEIVDLR